MNKETLIYHGGYSAISEPNIITSKFAKDFGDGFYCTQIEQQAKRWAARYETPIVSTYTFKANEQLNILEFAEMTEEWLDFIVACRAGKTHNYDIVVGAMANDQVYNYISDFVNGILTREQFWVLAKFKYPTHQVCFCTAESLKCLTYVESKEVAL